MNDDVTAAEATFCGMFENLWMSVEKFANMRMKQTQISRFEELSFFEMDEFTALKIASPSLGTISSVRGPMIPSDAREKSDSPMFCLVEGKKVADRTFKGVPNASIWCLHRPMSNRIPA